MEEKIAVILGDGMADYPDAERLTPLMRAHKPNIARLCAAGTAGLCRTVPEGMKPGSDTANLSVMGYDPKIYYTGRSPLEALSMGIPLKSTDLTYRCNLATVSDEPDWADKTMVDYSTGEISTPEAAELIACLADKLDLTGLLHAGVSYRHCLVQPFGVPAGSLTPPHDITGRRLAAYLPASPAFRALTYASFDVLKDHPINRARLSRGLNPANAIWLWGEGKKPALDDFYDKFGLKGAVISAVDLIKGIGIGAGMDSIDVAGATGTLTTDFDGKAAAAIEALGNHDFVYVHIEAPDECGHQGDAAGKVRAIECIDEKIVGPVYRYLAGTGRPFRMLVLPDHATPLSVRTHVADPVPYVLYDSERADGNGGCLSYDERSVAAGRFIANGFDLVPLLKNGW